MVENESNNGPPDGLFIIYIFFLFFSLLYTANSGQVCEKEFGIGQKIAMGIEIARRTRRPLSYRDRQDRVHQ